MMIAVKKARMLVLNNPKEQMIRIEPHETPAISEAWLPLVQYPIMPPKSTNMP